MNLALLLAGLTLLLVACGPDPAAKRYGPGVTDAEIKIGQTTPYSGPASAYSTMAKAEAAYFAMINDQGGVNGRKIDFVSLDDAYSPPRTVEQVRKLIESEKVLLLYHPLGTAPNTAIQKYMNVQKVPQLFLASGATKFIDPLNYPWSMSWQPSYELVARLYAQYLLKSRPKSRIAVLYQNDDFGKDYLKGLHDGLGEHARRMIVSEASYEITDPTVDSQIVSLSESRADILMSFSTPKFTAMGIRKAYDIGWRPVQFLNTLSSSVTAVLEPAGLEKSVGVITADYLKDPTDPQWRDDPATREFLAWMNEYNPGADPGDLMNVTGYSVAQTLIQVLTQCGEELTRENVMQQAANLRDLVLPMLLPGIRINTSPTDYAPIEQVRLARFDGKRWVLFGEVLEK